MAPETTHRRAWMLGALIAALAASSLLAGAAAARTHRPQCGYGVHIAATYTLHLRMNQTSGLFGIYLTAPQPERGAPNGTICVNVISRRNLPLDRTYTANHGSRMDVVHNRHSIFRGLGLHPQLFSDGIDITLLPGGLAAIEHCPGCYRFEVWPLGYRGTRPELSGRL